MRCAGTLQAAVRAVLKDLVLVCLRVAEGGCSSAVLADPLIAVVAPTVPEGGVILARRVDAVAVALCAGAVRRAGGPCLCPHRREITVSQVQSSALPRREFGLAREIAVHGMLLHPLERNHHIQVHAAHAAQGRDGRGLGRGVEGKAPGHQRRPRDPVAVLDPPDSAAPAQAALLR